MTARPRIRHCPVCGVAMQGSKSRNDLADFDTFECLTCHTVIREKKSRDASDDANAARNGSE